MIKINGTDIYLTRGDTAYLEVDVMQDDEEYEIQPNDTLTLTVKKSCNAKDYIFQKQLQASTTFKIEPTDTADLDFARYVYDVQADLENGDIFTVVPPSDFVVAREVTY